MTAMQKTTVQLSDPKKAGIYRFQGYAKDLVHATEIAGLQLIAVDFAKLQSKNQLLNAFAAAFTFPPHCGKNWDALNDALSDLSWSNAKGWVLTVKDAGRFAAKSPDAFAILIEILGSAVESWQAEGKPFWVILTGEAPPEHEAVSL